LSGSLTAVPDLLNGVSDMPAKSFNILRKPRSTSSDRRSRSVGNPVHLASEYARCARHHLLSVSAWLAEHPMLHTPQAGETNRLRTKRSLYQDGRAHCTAQENHGRFDQPSTLQTPVL